MHDNAKREITEEEAKVALEKGRGRAEKLLEDPDKLERILQRLEKKLKVMPSVAKELSLVPAMISLVRSYIKKEYTEIPLGAIVGMVSALIYILSPIDLIPDAIPVLGLSDDVAVFLLCLRNGAKDDIEEYERWRVKNNKKFDFE